MSKITEETGYIASLTEVDRMLIAALKKNLKATRYVATSLADGPQKEALEKMLKNHPLSPPEKVVVQPIAEPSVAMRRHSRLDRYLDIIPEENFQTVLDLVKSFCKHKKGKGGEGGASEVRPPKPRGRKKKGVGESGSAATSDASLPNALDSDTEARTA